MDKVFLAILNMSLTGAFVIVTICLARLPLKKAPKIISYCLWAVAGFRLVFPFSIESVFSLIPWGAQPIPQRSLLNESVSFGSAASAAYHAIGDAANGGLGTVTVYLGQTADGYPITTEAYHSQVWLLFFSYVWIAVAAVIFFYGIISYFLLKQKVRSAIRVEADTYESDIIQSPFVLGVLKPKIYIPFGLMGTEREYILLHERTHIRRFDHIVKFAAYFILCLHWFNPLVWIAFFLMGMDMEMSCDESVLKIMGMETKKDYSLSLLSLAANRRVIGGSPLAFSEGKLKQRIKNVLSFKKSSRVIITLAITFAMALSLGFAVNRAVKIKLPAVDEVLSITMNRYSEYQPIGEITVTDKSEIIQLLNALSGATKTLKTSVNDTPVSNNYLVVRLHMENEMRTLYLYTESVDYIEEPYAGIYRPKAKYDFAYSMYNAYLVRQNITVDTISVIVWKDDSGQTQYSLFEGDVTPTQSELLSGSVYNDVAGLNEALAEYPQDILSMIHVSHTMDFTKEEMIVITEQFVIPSVNYSMATGLYEFNMITLYEAREIVAERHPGWPDITYLGEDSINYKNAPAPAEVYKFEVVVSGLPVTCAVSKERGLFFTYDRGTWLAFDDALKQSGDLPNGSVGNNPIDNVVRQDYDNIQQNVNNGDEIWRLNPEEVALQYAVQVLGFQGSTTLYRNDGSEYARVIFSKQSGGEINIDLFQPAKKGDGGIWAVEHWFDENSRMYQVRDLTALPPLFYNDDNVPIRVREAVRKVVVDEWTETFSKHYQVMGFYANNVSYTEIDSAAELKFIMTLVTQNFYKDPDTVGYIKEAKEKDSINYQRMYEEYNMPRSGSIDMKATMLLTASGEVKPDTIQIYSNISPHGEEYVPVKAEDFIIRE